MGRKRKTGSANNTHGKTSPPVPVVNKKTPINVRSEMFQKEVFHTCWCESKQARLWAEDLIDKHGGKVTKSINESVTIIITGFKHQSKYLEHIKG